MPMVSSAPRRHRYLRVPSKAEQIQAEFKLEEHLQWYKDNFREIQRVELGANDIRFDRTRCSAAWRAPSSGLSTELPIVRD